MWRGIQTLVLVGTLVLALAASVVEAAPKTAVIDVQGMVCSG